MKNLRKKKLFITKIDGASGFVFENPSRKGSIEKTFISFYYLPAKLFKQDQFVILKVVAVAVVGGGGDGGGGSSSNSFSLVCKINKNRFFLHCLTNIFRFVLFPFQKISLQNCSRKERRMKEREKGGKTMKKNFLLRTLFF